jgi:hypothetical protein
VVASGARIGNGETTLWFAPVVVISLVIGLGPGVLGTESVGDPLVGGRLNRSTGDLRGSAAGGRDTTWNPGALSSSASVMLVSAWLPTP